MYPLRMRDCVRLSRQLALLDANYEIFNKSRVLSIMPNIPEISVGIQMERSVSVSSDRNIRDHLWRWSTYFGWNIPIEIRRSILANRFFALIREFGNDKKWQELFLLVGAV